MTKKLLSATQEHISATLNMPSATDKHAKIQAASSALQSVALALPHENVINELVTEVAAELRKNSDETKVSTATATVDQLVNALETNPNSNSLEESSNDICRTLDSCQGLPAGKVSGVCQKGYQKVTLAIAKSFDDASHFGGDGARMIAETLASFLPEVPLVKTSLDCFGQVRNMYLLMKEKKAISKDTEKYSFANSSTDVADLTSFQGYLAKSKGQLQLSKKLATMLRASLQHSMTFAR